MPTHPPMSHYQVGDTVYLGNTAFLIEEITDTHVNLRDPTLLYPISRVERRDTFEQMLAEDTRNDLSVLQANGCNACGI